MPSVKPLPGVVPANDTTPPAGARTGKPGSPPMSIPRCCPPAYGCARSNENVRRTGPSEGHVQASAVPGNTSPSTIDQTITRRNETSSVVCSENERREVSEAWARCQIRLQGAFEELVARPSGESRDDGRCL